MAKHTQRPAAPPPVRGNVMYGSVTDGDGTNVPSGHYWDRLEAAKSDKAELGKLLDELELHGYGRSGQIYTATLAAYNEAGGKKRSHGEG